VIDCEAWQLGIEVSFAITVYVPVPRFEIVAFGLAVVTVPPVEENATGPVAPVVVAEIVPSVAEAPVGFVFVRERAIAHPPEPGSLKVTTRLTVQPETPESVAWTVQAPAFRLLNVAFNPVTGG
jgi:hypothetical protein